MRKTIITALIGAVAACGAAAQDNGATVYTPRQGEIAFGVDIVPLLRTIDDAFDSKSGDITVGGDPFKVNDDFVKPNVAVTAKYMLTDRLSVGATLGLKVKNSTQRQYVTDDLAAATDPLSEAKVVDSRRYSRAGGSLMAGVEYRLGQRRVQGIVGGGILFGFSSASYKYSYGNAITSVNQHPSGGNMDNAAGAPSGYRPLSYHMDGPAYAVGAYGKIGVECFVAPKIALGATVDLYLYGTLGSKGYVKSEGFNAAYNRVEERTDLLTPGDRGFDFGTDNIGGSLYLAFYF